MTIDDSVLKLNFTLSISIVVTGFWGFGVLGMVVVRVVEYFGVMNVVVVAMVFVMVAILLL